MGERLPVSMGERAGGGEFILEHWHYQSVVFEIVYSTYAATPWLPAKYPVFRTPSLSMPVSLFV